MDKDKLQPKWYEWSVSIEKLAPGAGLLNHITQPVWFDNGQNTIAVFKCSMSHNKGQYLNKFSFFFFTTV